MPESSPQKSFKKSLENDSNSLDRNFYVELLHIIGLEEAREKNKTLIKRKAEAKRDEGSLLEKAIRKIDGKYSRFDRKKMLDFGATRGERVFNVALELCIVWTNRVLFLKLLESQLAGYHENEPEQYRFLNTDKIYNFGELYVLFHDVLNKTSGNRSAEVRKKYARVPFLNSSLFDFADVENLTITVGELDDNINLKLAASSILKKPGERAAALPTLDYLFRFLGAYDFAGESSEDLQKENRSLINASVPGKVFEKINGYRDGSVYTHGFITMYMCRAAIRPAVMQKFRDETDFAGDSFDDLEIYARRHYKAEDIRRFNDLVNSVKLCDPAVGSGHFLVSALNEILAIKSALGIFADESGKPFDNYAISAANDQLIVTDRENNLFEYKIRSGEPLDGEMHNLQKTLFHEKRTLIENCLFGVDINPNSVGICRLRLWIELLKNAYYKQTGDDAELETLPNIDINIKQGNSLLSRFAPDADLKQALKTKNDIRIYRDKVNQYKNERRRDAKGELIEIIDKIKADFRTEIFKSHPKMRDLAGKERRLFEIGSPHLFDKYSAGEREAAARSLKREIKALKAEIEAVETSAIYKNAFEWRFEFPEVLDDDGNFLGFDAVVGNPPYGVSIKGDLRRKVAELYGKAPDFEIYYFFINLARKILKLNGIKSFIIPNSILFNVFAKDYRKNLFNEWRMTEILDCTDFDIFVGSATVRNIITLFVKEENEADGNINAAVGYRPTINAQSFEELVGRELSQTDRKTLLGSNRNWALIFKLEKEILDVTSKIRNEKPFLSAYFPEISQGLIAYDKYQGQDEHIIKTRAFHGFEQLKGCKPWLRGEDVARYSVRWNEKDFINYCDGIANPRAQIFQGRKNFSQGNNQSEHLCRFRNR